MTELIADVAARHAGGRIVSVLEGGYDLDALARSAVNCLTERMLNPGMPARTLQIPVKLVVRSTSPD